MTPSTQGLPATGGPAVPASHNGATAPVATDDAALDEIYQQLRKGLAHERVTDGNVDALIARARDDGDAQLELLLREWRSPCGEEAQQVTLEPRLPPP